MAVATTEPAESRVLVFAPVGRDAPLLQRAVAGVGLQATVCSQLDDLANEIAAGAATVLFTEEAMGPATVERLRVVLARQPTWSDLPLVVLTGADEAGHARRATLSPLEATANITLVERPVRVRTLEATVLAATRSRSRQYQMRDLVLQLERSAAERADLLARERDARAEAEIQRERVEAFTATVLESERSFRAVFDQSLDAMLLADDARLIVDANPAACALLGYPKDELLRCRVSELVAPADRLPVPAIWKDFTDAGKQRGEMTLVRRDHTTVVVEYSAAANVTPGRHLSVLRDIADRRRAEESLRFLAEASGILGASLDYHSTLASVARLAVPRIADWAAVDMLESDGSLNRLAVAHSDPSKIELAWELWRKYPTSMSEPHGVPQVLRSGLSDVHADIPDALLAASIPDPELLRIIRALGLVSSMCVPIPVRGRPVGAITFVSADSKRHFGATDLTLAEDLARRVGLAIDNARTFGEAQLANRMKDEFLATVSHELRTPLNAMLGYARMLRTGAMPSERRDHALEVIERNARAQAQLVEDLLDISRVISGKLRLDVRSLEPIITVHAALDALRPAADARSIRLEADLDPEAGPIQGDPDRLQQVIWNLLSNAIKFTPMGGSVQVRLRRDGSNIEIRVEDSGQGISPEFLPFVFDRFRQADGSAARTHQGLGLGLAIARSLVELHGGTITASSEGEGRGAQFVLRLPIAPGRTSAPDATAHSSSRPADVPLADRSAQLDGVRVLVVDDEADARELATLILTRCNAVVRAAESAAAAMAAFESELPDMVVSDIGMPGEDGLALIRRIRALPANRGGRTPALALTAYARPEDRERALAAGFDRHIAKPIEPAQLLDAVAAMTQRAKA